MRPRPAIHLLWAALLLWLVPSAAHASTVQTGFTDACHERFTYDATKTLLLSDELVSPDSIPLPSGDVWEAVSDSISRDLDVSYESDREEFMVMSFMLGSRYPDTRGRSITNAKSLREIHRDPADQDSHFLRSSEHDYAEGNVAAREAGLAYIQARTTQAFALLDEPEDDQIIKVSQYLDLYGMVDVEVWGPAFYMGVAAHTVQDSFSHTLRSEDLTRILHVCNYVDAVTYSYDAERDGLRHSWAMDRCTEEAAPIAPGSRAATRDLFRLVSAAPDEREARLEDFFESWMEYQPGCDGSNDFCGSPWLEIARTDESLPILEEIFSCSQGETVGAGASLVIPLVLLLAGLLALRRRIDSRRESR